MIEKFVWFIQCSQCFASETLDCDPYGAGNTSELRAKLMAKGSGWTLSPKPLCAACSQKGGNHD
jgi:hypothetical protein